MIKTRHILFLQSSSEQYGSGKIILQVLRLYRSESLTPVVVLTGPGPLVEELKEDGFLVRIQNLGILRRKYVNPAGLLNRFSKNLKAYRFLDQLHSEFKFELVYSNTLAVIVGAYWAKRNRLPHIWHIHEILPGPAPLVKLLSKMIDSSTPRPIAVSEAVSNHWKPKLKLAKMEVVHNAIPYDEFLKTYPTAKSELRLPVNKLIITMIGRINPGKGQLFFLDMASRISKTFPQCHFVLVGDPFPGYEYIQEEIRIAIIEKGISEKVIDLGFRKDISKIGDLKVGEWYPGLVTNITQFGAFVDIGIKENGLLHVSQISDTFVENAMTALKVGQVVKVQVLEVDYERGRISLTAKQGAQVNRAPTTGPSIGASKSQISKTQASTQSVANIKNNAFAGLKNLKL